MRWFPLACKVAVLLLVCHSPVRRVAAGEDAAAGSRPLQRARERLDRSITLEVYNQPVETAVRRLAEAAHCPVSIGRGALKRDSDPPRRVRLAVYDVPASYALELIIAQAEWADSVVVVPDAGQGVRIARRAALRPVRTAYDVAGLAGALRAHAGDELTETAATFIQETVAPDTWEANGGSLGRVEQDPERQRLHVTTTPDLHEQIAQFLAELLAEAEADAGDVIAQPEEPAYRRARGLLEQSAWLPAKGQTLREALAHWHRQTDLPLVVHWDELETAGIPPRIPLDVPGPRGASVPARDALTTILQTAAAAVEGSRLGFHIDRDGVVCVSTAERSADVVTRPYNLRPVLEAWSKDPAFKRAGKTLEEWMDEVVRLLTETIAPDTWREAGGSVGTAKVWGTDLIVTQTRENHERLAALLHQLAGEDAGSTVQVKWGHDGPGGEAAPTLVTRLYRLGEITRGRRGRGAAGGETWEEAAEYFSGLIQEKVAPDTWRDNGGSVGALITCGPYLVVTQTPENQRRVAVILRRPE